MTSLRKRCVLIAACGVLSFGGAACSSSKSSTSTTKPAAKDATGATTAVAVTNKDGSPATTAAPATGATPGVAQGEPTPGSTPVEDGPDMPEFPKEPADNTPGTTAPPTDKTGLSEAQGDNWKMTISPTWKEILLEPTSGSWKVDEAGTKVVSVLVLTGSIDSLATCSTNIQAIPPLDATITSKQEQGTSMKVFAEDKANKYFALVGFTGTTCAQLVYKAANPVAEAEMKEIEEKYFQTFQVKE
jgi:hypothetical protein